MARIVAAQERAVAGDRQGAREAFAAVWADLGEEGDALHVVSLAHYAADVQDDPREELAWDEVALRAAERLTDERARRYHEGLSVRGFLASLHLNLAADHAKLGDRQAALEHLSGAEAALPDLPPGGYADMIRGGVVRLRTELGPA
ncbi:hypothetical protein [Pseudonocardia alaniniphila]|uniref:Tetratricopeptide repeat protein n=1 Tax=Pseudonocardia alaniniphila TaxID=75291 RepID=A0ABS9TQ90_9PSEU|nr:hypothetical protein [Pseudonocardia alaniniphila]MCH6170701.1 hypothetical protein [Pseudonocardia alaniniphila]